MNLPTFEDVRTAHGRIDKLVHRTPVLTSRHVNRRANMEIFFKCENLQKVGAFKIRGATNAVMALADEEAGRGVATHSSGNHAAALAQAARWRGIDAHVVMPSNTSEVKKRAVAGYDARITYCESTLGARESTLDDVVADTGAHFVHPYDNPFVVAGQGTAALELVEDVDGLDALIAPVGGGGLLSGTALVARALSPRTQLYGGEPTGADDAARGLAAGERIASHQPQTVADGLRTTLGEITFRILREHVTDILTVDDDATIEAMRFVWERMKILIEPSSAVPLAALFEKAPSALRGKRVGLILSGGNVDLDALPWR